jgi:penicillin-binding protein 1A
MLARLPKAPSTGNPIANPKRARARMNYVLERMYALGHISETELDQAKAQAINVRAARLRSQRVGRLWQEWSAATCSSASARPPTTSGVAIPHHHLLGTPIGGTAGGVAQGAGRLPSTRHGLRGPTRTVRLPEARRWRRRRSTRCCRTTCGRWHAAGHRAQREPARGEGAETASARR